MNTISYTVLDVYTRCPRKYKYNYIDRLIKSEFQIGPMSLGSAIHAGMAYGLMLYHASKYTLEVDELYAQLQMFFSEWREANRPTPKMIIDQYGNIVEDSTVQDFFEMVNNAREITYRTFIHLDVNNNWRTVELNGRPIIEWRDEVKILEDIMFQFQIDWIATSIHDGLTYLIDWKSRRSFQDDEKESALSGEDHNLQMCLYAKSMQILGINVDATITYQISPYAPKVPDLINKETRVSRSNIKTTWEDYKKRIIEIGDDPDDVYYADMKEKLNEIVWFKPVTIFRPQSEIDTRWGDAKRWTRQIYNDNYFIPIESIQCAYCPFSKLCIGRARGWDVQEIMEKEYSVREVLTDEPESVKIEENKG